MQAFRIAVVLIVLTASAYLFRKASGSLKLKKLNMISIIFYYMLVFNLIGASLIYIGFRDHYLIRKITSPDTIDKTYYYLAYCMIMFPLTLLAVRKCFRKFRNGQTTIGFVEKEIRYSDRMIILQRFTLVLMLICTLATVYVFLHLGYIPVISMFTGGNLDALRQSGNRFFQGNQYIKNLLMSTLTPFVSYFIYIYFRLTKSKSWAVMFIYMALLSVIVLTYDFSKSPIITYLLGFYLIEVLLGNIENNQRFKKLVIAAVAIILVFYVFLFNAGSSLFSIYTGPVGRVVFTQIATLFLHVDAFPRLHGFLQGASFYGWMSLFIPNAAGIRSGRLVMELFNASAVEANTAGVMNTVFIGEAYANFGTAGVIVAPIVFGIIIGLASIILQDLKKTPVSILLYVQTTLLFISMVEGGFVDIFYSASLVFLILVAVAIRFFSGGSRAVKLTTVQRKKII